jgi:hypothetical protein
MCCPLLILVFLGPRFAFAFVWLFTSRVTEAFSGNWILALLGLIFLPWTALAYVAAWAPTGGVTSIGWAVVIIGFILDIATYSGRAAQQRYESR